MPKRISSEFKDPNQIAAAVVGLTAVENQPLASALLSQVMSEMGRKGGKIGGKRRLQTMTPKQRKTAARRAAKARWGKRQKAEQ